MNNIEYRDNDEKVEDLIILYEILNQIAINDIILNIPPLDIMLDIGMYQNYMNNKSVKHIEKISNAVKKVKVKSKIKVKDCFKTNINNHFKRLNKIYNKVNVNKDYESIIKGYYNATNGEYNNLLDKFPSYSYNTFNSIINMVKYNIIQGKESQTQAIQKAITILGNKGIPIKTNRKESLESCVRRIIVTGVNKCTGDINLQYAIYNGFNHVLVSSHLGARHVENPEPEYLSHDIWQGKVYKVGELNVGFTRTNY